jgi:uncharacterized protein
MIVELIPLKESYSIYKIKSINEVLQQSIISEFYSISVTNEEVTVICKTGLINNYVNCEPDWKGFKIKGILDFSLIGIIHTVTKPLKDNNISVFVVSTFNTDYLFVKADKFEEVKQIFKDHKDFKICFDSN